REARPVMRGVVAAAVALAVAACGPATMGAGPAPAAAGAPAAGRSGARAPDFQLDALDGSTVRLGDHLGREVVLLDFWATFCEPCLAAMPHLDALYRRQKARGFLVLGVSIDGPETLAQVRATASRLGVTFPVLL